MQSYKSLNKKNLKNFETISLHLVSRKQLDLIGSSKCKPTNVSRKQFTK